MKKSLFICIVLSMFFALYSCSSKSDSKNESRNFIDYENYELLFNNMNQNMKIKNYKNLGGNEGIDLVCIEKQLSFGKRSYLTTDNKQSNTPTQKRIEYLDEKGKSIAAIDLIYLDKSLNNDLVYWSSSLDGKRNEFIRNNYDDNIISYKNILIKISLYSIGTNEIEGTGLLDISIDVVDYIKSSGF